MPFLAVLACLCRVKKFGVSSSSSIFLNVPTTLIGPPLVAIKLMAAFALSEASSLSASTFATALLTADSMFKSVFSHKVLTLAPNFVAAVSAVSTSAASSTRSFFAFCLASSLFNSASFIFSSFFLRISSTNLTFSCPTSMAFSYSACTAAFWLPHFSSSAAIFWSSCSFKLSKFSGMTTFILLKALRMPATASVSACNLFISSCLFFISSARFA
mmetsp:Transcript_58627/g.166477  ORF Transcript_58627/g.166477 Transcript_58627/m.166477 type:complete len:215 (-) Transcript_58627:283-927(-)